MSEIEYGFILLGNSGVGKTCLFKKLSTSAFPTGKMISTIGIDRKKLEYNININNNQNKPKKFIINLYDTSGAEKYRPITRNYYRKNDAFIILYDITNKQSFIDIEKWIADIKDNIGNKDDSKFVIFLIGNKLELIEEDKNKREITEEEAKNLCEKYGLIFGKELSVKNIDFNELNE